MTVLYRAQGLLIAGRLEPTDLRLKSGELAILVGPNGAGKTSLLRAAAGIEGEAEDIVLAGTPLRKVSPARRSRLLAFAGASRDVRWPLRARDYVALGLTCRSDHDRIERALKRFSAEKFGSRRIDRLSTGERSRVMLARAIVAEPNVILLDEPCSNLDPYWQVGVVECLRDYVRSGKTALISVHDLDLALAHADRLIVMDRGRIVSDAPPADAGTEALIGDVFSVARNASGWNRI